MDFIFEGTIHGLSDKLVNDAQKRRHGLSSSRWRAQQQMLSFDKVRDGHELW